MSVLCMAIMLRRKYLRRRQDLNEERQTQQIRSSKGRVIGQTWAQILGHISSISSNNGESSAVKSKDTNVSSYNSEEIAVDYHAILKVGLREHWIISPEDIEVKDTVGKGGFGEVKRGVLYKSSDVVIKFANVQQHDDSARLTSKMKSLANEVRLFRKLHHENIVNFHGILFSESADTPAQLGIVLEWIDGGNLEEYCSKHANDSDRQLFSEVRVLLLDIARGMVYLHAQSPPILHRDLKPANVLVDSGSPPQAKLTDFGLSDRMNPDGQMSKRVGTRRYMAPEVMQGQFYNSSADVFSFGCTLLFAMTLNHPPEAEDPLLVINVLDLQRRYPNVCIKLANMCMQPVPLDRPSFAIIYKMLTEAVSDFESLDLPSAHDSL